MSFIPNNLLSLHTQEEVLREKALITLNQSKNCHLHLTVIEAAMDLADVYRQFESECEDVRIVQVLGIRTFNAFGASLKLSFSGYQQNAALVMRDVLETIFLLSYFSTNKHDIALWRNADKKTRLGKFGPAKIRKALDKRDGFTSGKRDEAYDLFCELAGHPNVRMADMLRPTPDSKIALGPFLEPSSLEAVLAEMGKLAVQVGENLSIFISDVCSSPHKSQIHFNSLKTDWIKHFFG